MSTSFNRTAVVSDALSGNRLDQAAAVLFAEFSRTRLQRWIRDGRLCINGTRSATRAEVHAGDVLSLVAELEAEGVWPATEMALAIAYEDEHVLVIDKPVGLVMHPAAGHSDDTLLNGLLARYPELVTVPRAGIVHRIDRDTSGLLVVARTLAAQTRLVSAIQAREVSREYLAVVNGVLVSGGSVDKPIGRHARDRQRMAVVLSGGKPALTHYRVATRFRAHTLLSVLLDTGRTHQIRVHMASIAHPIVGDQVYGGRPKLPRAATQELIECVGSFPRQALHATRLRFAHPESGAPLEIEAPLPQDMRDLVDTLARDQADYHAV